MWCQASVNVKVNANGPEAAQQRTMKCNKRKTIPIRDNMLRRLVRIHARDSCPPGFELSLALEALLAATKHFIQASARQEGMAISTRQLIMHYARHMQLLSGSCCSPEDVIFPPRLTAMHALARHQTEHAE
jgi:hypothetical protein